MEDKIRQAISIRMGDEIYCQLAEECSELAQAALKMHRALDGTSPTPLTDETCWGSLIEEFTDVVLVASVIGLDTNYVIWEHKLNRWLDRLGLKEKSE